MTTTELGYFIAGILNGAALGFATCAWLWRRHVRRTVQQIAALFPTEQGKG